MQSTTFFASETSAAPAWAHYFHSKSGVYDTISALPWNVGQTLPQSAITCKFEQETICLHIHFSVAFNTNDSHVFCCFLSLGRFVKITFLRFCTGRLHIKLKSDNFLCGDKSLKCLLWRFESKHEKITLVLNSSSVRNGRGVLKSLLDCTRTRFEI